MEQAYVQELLKLAPFGYAYHKLVVNDLGEPEDYIFLEVNPAFEAMTGLDGKAIIGKRVTTVLPGIRQSNFDWVAFYGNVAQTGESVELSQYAENLDRWYKVTAYSPEKDHFAVFINEVTNQVAAMQELDDQKKQIDELTDNLKTIYNISHDAMFLAEVTPDGRFLYVSNNLAHQTMVGFSLEVLRGKTPVELFGPDAGAALEANYRRCIEVGDVIEFEETIASPGGRRAWLTTLMPVRDQGIIRYIVGSRKDVTQQRKAEAERNALLQRFERMMNGHTAVMLLIEPESGRIVDANPAACAFYGYTRDELLSLTTGDLNELPEEDVHKLRLETMDGGTGYFQFRHRLKNGEIRLMDVHSCAIGGDGENLLFSINFDVTERERQREELYREKEMLRITLQSIGDGVVTTDSEGNIAQMNKVAQEITQWSREEAVGRKFTSIFRLLSEETGDEVQNPIAQVLQTGRIIGLANHTVLVNKQGHYIAISDSAAPIRDETGNTFGVVMVFQDVSTLKAQQEEIRYLSYHDHLTGLYNRRFMEEELERLDTARQLPLAVIMGDVNGLKLTNDVFGHHVGDVLLKKVAAVLTENCRQEDIIARWGGDEFLILLPRTNAEQAEKIIERIKAGCASQSNNSIQISLSLGSAVKGSGDQVLQHVLKGAEEWMYHRKLLDSKSYRNTILNTLLTTLYEKNMETEEHAERLKEYCQAIGSQFGLPPMELDELTLLAVLHDIGKVGVKESILQKPGPLTPQEWEEIRMHPEIGYRIAQNTPELAAVAEYILSHHEHWDGGGYPRGLKGDEIPLQSRILAVADAYDAMTSDRVYRKGLPRETALRELKDKAGSQFDPAVTDAFFTVVEG